MSYIKAFSEKLAGLNSNLDTYFKNLTEYQKKIPHQLLGAIIGSAEKSFKFAQKNSMELVDHLKVREAFNNHKLGAEKLPTKLLYAAIQENPIQFGNAFDLHTKTHSDKIYEFTQNITQAKAITDQALEYARVLLNADWRPGDEKPLDENPKWVWLTDGLFTYLEKDAKYDLKNDQWDIKHQTSDPYFTIHHWTDIAGV